jgi:hypothetical protein
MGIVDQFMLRLDETVTRTLSQWDVYTTTIAAVLLTIFIYNVSTNRDPDTHPMLLARQAQASPVRQDGESAVYRSHGSPHGMALNGGLNVKDPGTSKWARGRDGDLRDIWRRAANGSPEQEGKVAGEKGRILTVLGSEKVVEHDLGESRRTQDGV